MKKSINLLIRELKEKADGSLQGGFMSIRGGKSLMLTYPTNDGNCPGSNTFNCANDGNCTGTNSLSCHNDGTCGSSSNSSGCSNDGMCFA